MEHLRNQNKIGGNVGSDSLSYDALKQKYDELEQTNQILQAQTKTVVVYNRSTGAFEYIGEPTYLNSQK